MTSTRLLCLSICSSLPDLFCVWKLNSQIKLWWRASSGVLSLLRKTTRTRHLRPYLFLAEHKNTPPSPHLCCRLELSSTQIRPLSGVNREAQLFSGLMKRHFRTRSWMSNCLVVEPILNRFWPGQGACRHERSSCAFLLGWCFYLNELAVCAASV